MIRELVERIAFALQSRHKEDGAPRAKSPLEVLTLLYQEELRLAHQLDAHAGQAPYPSMRERMRQLASEKRNSAGSVKERLLALGGTATEPQNTIKSGRNHWERLQADLEDQRKLENLILDHTIFLADDAPEISEFLRQIASAEIPIKDALIDLVMRADPQAHQIT